MKKKTPWPLAIISLIVSVGAGKGRYTVYLASRVGPEGKVYANDIDETGTSNGSP